MLHGLYTYMLHDGVLTHSCKCYRLSPWILYCSIYLSTAWLWRSMRRARWFGVYMTPRVRWSQRSARWRIRRACCTWDRTICHSWADSTSSDTRRSRLDTIVWRKLMGLHVVKPISRIQWLLFDDHHIFILLLKIPYFKKDKIG